MGKKAMATGGAFHEVEQMALGIAAGFSALRDTLEQAFPAPAPLGTGEEPENPLEVDLGDGNTYADLMGCGVIIVEQVDHETGQTHHVVLTEENLERLLSAVRRRV